MRIVHVVTRLAGGGTEKNLAAALAVEVGAGHQVTVICGSVSDAYKRLVPQSVEFVPLPSLQRDPSLFRDLRAWWVIRRLLRNGAYDVVHTHQAKAGALTRLFASKAQGNVVIHTVHMANFGPGYSRLASEVYQGIERYCARRTDYLCFVGEELKSGYLEARVIPRRGSVVMRSSLEVDRFLAVRSIRDQSDRQTDPVSERPYAILMIGALEPRKRHILALAAFAPQLRSGEFELIVAGDGPERSKIIASASEIGAIQNVQILGHVNNVDELLAAADVLVHVSTAEGVPQAVMQALMAGVPVVATDVQGLREIADAQLTIAARDGSDLALKVAENRGQPPSRTASERFEPWHPRTVAKAYGTLLNEIASESTAWSRRLEVDAAGGAGA